MGNYRINPISGKLEKGSLKQEFEATADQTIFTVTNFTLTDGYMVFIDGAIMNEAFSVRNGQAITLPAQPEGTIIIIAN